MYKLASISVDFEDLSHFFRTLGLEPKVSSQKLYHCMVYRFLELFKELDIRATFFFIGSDASKPENRQVIRAIADAGHEIANHTMTHPFGFRRCSREEKLDEIATADKVLADIAGCAVVGFRAPCGDIDSDILDILESLDYTYDSSVYPSPWNPLQNIVYYILSNGRPLGMGEWKCGWAPAQPYQPGEEVWRRGVRTLFEMPIATIPYIRIPFYSTPLLAFGMASFDYVWPLVRKRRILNYQLHSIDLVDFVTDNVSDDLRRHPAMKRDLNAKTNMLKAALSQVAQFYQILPMKEIVNMLADSDAETSPTAEDQIGFSF